MIKKAILPALLVLSSLPLCAATSGTDILKSYVTKALAKCPDQKITLEPITHPGPVSVL